MFLLIQSNYQIRIFKSVIKNSTRRNESNNSRISKIKRRPKNLSYEHQENSQVSGEKEEISQELKVQKVTELNVEAEVYVEDELEILGSEDKYDTSD